MELIVRWTRDDIIARRPDWDDEKCYKFLGYIEAQLLQAAEAAGNNVIDNVMGINPGVQDNKA